MQDLTLENYINLSITVIGGKHKFCTKNFTRSYAFLELKSRVSAEWRTADMT